MFMIVELQERGEFSFKILSIPKEDAVKVFAANCSSQTLNEGMRYRGIRVGFDFLDLENP